MNVSRTPYERIAKVEQRVEHMEEELDKMSSKVDDMHAIIMQAKGVRWAIITFSGLVGFLIGVGSFLATLHHWGRP